MLGEEHGQHREAAETLTSGVQLELGRVLGSGAWEGTGREVKVFENPGNAPDPRLTVSTRENRHYPEETKEPAS